MPEIAETGVGNHTLTMNNPTLEENHEEEDTFNPPVFHNFSESEMISITNKHSIIQTCLGVRECQLILFFENFVYTHDVLVKYTSPSPPLQLLPYRPPFFIPNFMYSFFSLMH